MEGKVSVKVIGQRVGVISCVVSSSIGRQEGKKDAVKPCISFEVKSSSGVGLWHVRVKVMGN